MTDEPQQRYGLFRVSRGGGMSDVIEVFNTETEAKAAATERASDTAYHYTVMPVNVRWTSSRGDYEEVPAKRAAR